MSTSNTNSDEYTNSHEDDSRIQSLPSELDSMGAKLVYFHLHSTGGGTVVDLRHTLNIPTISIYPILRSLQEDDLVTRIGNRYVCTPSR